MTTTTTAAKIPAGLKTYTNDTAGAFKDFITSSFTAANSDGFATAATPKWLSSYKVSLVG